MVARLMTLAQREAFFHALEKNNPNPQTELEYASPFQLLAAVLLSAQATDISVNKATRKLFVVASTPQAIFALGEDGLVPYIQTIGLYRTKAKHLIATCEILTKQFDGEVPQDRESLESLPGVGRKTANVVLNTAFKQPTMAVDTHIFRVSNRTGLAPGKDVLEVEQQLLKRVPKPYLMGAHHWLILLGRYTCKARSPQCGACLVEPVCHFKDKQSINLTGTLKGGGLVASKSLANKVRDKLADAAKNHHGKGVTGLLHNKQDSPKKEKTSQGVRLSNPQKRTVVKKTVVQVKKTAKRTPQ